jgi:surface polysaccharide O-acyltransferase-like enzyme
MAALFLRHKRERLLVAVGVALYLVGLAGKAYADTPIGFHAAFNFRNGPFCSLILFVTGYFLHRKRTSRVWLPVGLLLAILGTCLHFTELWLLNSQWGTAMRQDYVIGTYFAGVGVSMMALSNVSCRHLEGVASIGRLVLGIYASHLVFVDLLMPLDRRFRGSPLWDILFVVAVFTLSYALVLVMSRFRLTRRLVA